MTDKTSKQITMKIGVKYIVTKASKNKEFRVRDVIWKVDDGSILNQTAKGWMSVEDVPKATAGIQIRILQ